MQKESFINNIKEIDKLFFGENKLNYSLPIYNPETHYKDVGNSNYYRALVCFRNNIKHACDFYWSNIQKAYNVDLFMLTPSVSSPMGPGSDSEAIDIKFGNLKTYLVDSSQFGFEPILLNNIDKVYCYLPSMRGENPDSRHLNQFYHCEAEIKGGLDDLIPQMEKFVQFLAETCLAMPNLFNLISENGASSKEYLESIVSSQKFDQVEYGDMVKTLEDNGFKDLVNYTSFGRDVSSKGELEFLKIINAKRPVWIRNFDRDRVAFYQKPTKDGSKVINCDLIFPQIYNDSFWGEIIGAGQRQDVYEEMLESLNRQKIDSEPYQWYMDLRKNEKYTTTSGFGLGVERFIAWVLCKDDIKDVILYPRLKNILTYP